MKNHKSKPETHNIHNKTIQKQKQDRENLQKQSKSYRLLDYVPKETNPPLLRDMAETIQPPDRKDPPQLIF